jgi:uncharacterized membrane protein
MRTKDFLNQLNHDRIVSTIRAAEANTSGQIRVYIQRGELDGDALVEARAKFKRLGMEQTNERNGILIFVTPRARKFAVIGDKGIHAKCGAEFWDRLVVSMREHFLNSNFTNGLAEAIEEAGRVLARHFPKKASPQNELPDEIVEG